MHASGHVIVECWHRSVRFSHSGMRLMHGSVPRASATENHRLSAVEYVFFVEGCTVPCRARGPSIDAALGMILAAVFLV
jgi:hypothetical protein